MLKVGDIMSKEVFTLSASCSIHDALWGLCERGIGGAPVEDAQGRLVGVVTKTDLGDPDSGPKPLTVYDVMTPAVLAVDLDDDAEAAMSLMRAHDIHRVIVLNKLGNLCGIVTAIDCRRRVTAAKRRQASRAAPASALPA